MTNGTFILETVVYSFKSNTPGFGGQSAHSCGKRDTRFQPMTEGGRSLSARRPHTKFFFRKLMSPLVEES